MADNIYNVNKTEIIINRELFFKELFPKHKDKLINVFKKIEHLKLIYGALGDVVYLTIYYKKAAQFQIYKKFVQDLKIDYGPDKAGMIHNDTAILDFE